TERDVLDRSGTSGPQCSARQRGLKGRAHMNTRAHRMSRISRRTALKGVGLGALALGTGDALAACGSSLKGSGGTNAGTITIGFITPQTGALAGFASGDNFVVDQIRKTQAYAKGFKAGGKTYTVNIVVKDTQSDPNRASQVARELILQNHADMVVTSSTP